MAHKKGQGSTKNNRDSESKRLGVKIFGGQPAIPGNIIIRQRGTKVHPGTGVGMGKDHTIYAMDEGVVTFTTKKNNRKFVHVLPIEAREEIKGKQADAKSDKAEKTVTSTKTTAKKADAKKVDSKKTEAKKSDAKKETAKKETTKKVDAKKADAKKTDAKQADAKKADAKKATAAKAPAKEEKKKPAAKTSSKSKAKGDDLRKIEGIGPKIAGLLNDANIVSFSDLANAKVDALKEILLAAGSRYQMHDPTTWPKQAKLAAEDKWDELKEYQDNLDGGKE